MNSLSIRFDAGAVCTCPAPPVKQDIFDLLGKTAARSYGLNPELVAERLAARETLGSTGFGSGIAIPHAKITGLEQCVGLFLRLDQPLDFDAHDGKPVDLIFGLLSSDQGGSDHLKALAEVSRFLRDETMTAKLRGARGEDALYALLSGQRGQRAA